MKTDPASRTAAAGPAPVETAVPAATSTPPPRCRIDGATLRIDPFTIVRHGQHYRSPDPLAIDLAAVAPGRYRVLAVHNFHVEDGDPDLDSGVAGVFLAARRADGAWEEPERFPIECRTVGVLGEVEIGGAGR